MTSDEFLWDLPTKVLFGSGRIKKLKNEKMPGTKALLVCPAGNSLRANGSLKYISGQLEEAGVQVVLFDRVSKNPDDTLIMEAVEMARSEGCDLVVGLGGGSVIDAAKTVAAVAPSQGEIWDYMDCTTGGKKAFEREPLPCIAIPTTSGNGSEVTSVAAVTHGETREKYDLKTGFPVMSVTDPQLMVTVSPEDTAYQGFTAFMHGVEGYISSKRTAPAQMAEIAVLGNIAQFLGTAIEDGADMDARSKLAFASTMAGMSTELGSSAGLKAMAYALSGEYPDIPYGAVLAMLAESYFKFFIDRQACDEVFMEMCMGIGVIGPESAFDFLFGLRDLKEAWGLSGLKMSDFGIEKEKFADLAKRAKTGMWYLFENGPAIMSENDIKEVYEAAYEGITYDEVEDEEEEAGYEEDDVDNVEDVSEAVTGSDKEE